MEIGSLTLIYIIKKKKKVLTSTSFQKVEDSW